MTNKVYVVTFLVVLGLAALTQAQTFTTLYQFTSGSDGEFPYAGVVQDKAGKLYGTTMFGGTLGYGVVFKLNTFGQKTVLHNFGASGDGQYPADSLTRDGNGNLYGTTSHGGAKGDHGTVFKIDTAGNETVLHSFAGGRSDGCSPQQGLLRDKAGNLYGTTALCGSAKQGTIFKIDSAGNFSILHSFAGSPSDGSSPVVGHLTMDTKGNLYGLTWDGGANQVGALYKLSRKGKLSLLYSFQATGWTVCGVAGTVALDKNGNLYGTTELCGSLNYGTIWKVSKKGKETILHDFGPSDGCEAGGVVRDAKGNLYGTLWGGCGSSYYGALWELSAGGTFTLLHSFNSSDGQQPDSDLWRTNKGELFGATSAGGFYGYGTVWSYVP